MKYALGFRAVIATWLLTTEAALAQPTESEGWYMMHPYMGWGGGIMMIFIWGIIIFLLFVLARSLGATHQSIQKPTRTAIEILKERFAKGEIDKEEFEEKRDILMR